MQKLQLSIPEPCHESWQQMTPTEQGRFCNACAKEVIDFSTMTDIQVLNYFTNMTHEKVCGRALPEQLDRAISRPGQPKKRLFWYWNYLVMFLMFFAKGNGAKAQTARTQAGNVQVITAADLEKIRSTNINNALAGKIEGPIVTQIVSGKITDVDGNPVSFASVKIKGTGTGVSADANGRYSIRIRTGETLEIIGANFKTLEVPVGTRTVVDIVMEISDMPVKEVLVTVAGAIKRTARCGTSSIKTIVVNPTIIFEVKEDSTGLAIDKALIIITKKGDVQSDTAINEKKGFYKYNETIEGENYFIKVESAGYESNEFTISTSDFKDRKKEWEVLLSKENLMEKRQTDINNALAGKVPGIQVSGKSAANLGRETQIRVGAIFAKDTGNNPIYVVDGIIMPISPKTDINTDDIEDISFLQGPAAAALFGSQGANGAIVITTRKKKEKTLDTVWIQADYGSRRRIAGGMSGYSIISVSYLADTKARINTVLSDSLKVYPNPVMRNSSFSVALKLKDAGGYQLQFSDASGRIVLQKQFNVTAKNHTETLQPKNWAAGIYYIRVFNKNKLISKTSFIFE